MSYGAAFLLRLGDGRFALTLSLSLTSDFGTASMALAISANWSSIAGSRFAALSVCTSNSSLAISAFEHQRLKPQRLRHGFRQACLRLLLRGAKYDDLATGSKGCGEVAASDLPGPLI